MSVYFGDPKLTPWHEQYQLQQEQNNTKKALKKIEKEQCFLQSVQNEGVVHQLTESDLLENGKNSFDKTPPYPGDIYMLHLSSKRLNRITIIDLCERLTICNLSNNFIQNIKPLKLCQNLICLDIHGNQINHLPDGNFWSSLSKLLVLYGHDNGIFKLDELKHLSHSPSLLNITLYDTPISLKKNYRHCVVNAVWTLKALDHYVVSDEEIIEDANFSKLFKPMQTQFFFKSMYLSTKPITPILLKSEMILIRKDLAVINSIQAKFCPVLILQRCIRGFLIRLRYNYIMDTRLWAAVSIQRFYRSCKGYPDPPPSTPIMRYQDLTNQSLSNMKLNYETYLKMRRSKHKSWLSMKSEKSAGFQQIHSTKSGADIPKNKAAKKRISIVLEKFDGKATKFLQKGDSLSFSRVKSPNKKGTSRIVQSAPIKKDSYPDDVIQFAQELGLNTICIKNNSLRNRTKMGKYYTQYQFLGDVVQKNPILDENDNTHSFRLNIQKPHVMKLDPLEEIILRTIEGADDIRKSIKEIDNQIKSTPAPKKTLHKKAVNSHQKLYLKTQGSMSLSCFRAVDKAYRDRHVAEQLLKRMNHAKHIKDAERKSIERVNQYKQNYREEILSKKHSETIGILKTLKAKRQTEAELVDNFATKHTAMKDIQQKRKQNYKFAIEFCCQNASVGKALANHDRNTRYDDALEQRARYVKKIKDEIDTKKDLVADYMQDMKLLRQANTMATKDNVEAILAKNAETRESELFKLLKSHRDEHERKLMTPTVIAVKEIDPLVCLSSENID